MLESDKAILHQPLETFDHKEACQIKHSIKELTPLVKISINAANLLGKKFKKITSYFRPVSHNTRQKHKLHNKPFMKKKKTKRRYTNRITAYSKQRRKIYCALQDPIKEHTEHYSKNAYQPTILPEPDP